MRATLLSVTFVGLAFLTGCQVEVGGSVGSKLFYPDKLGKKEIGDPRKPMMSAPNYKERHISGSESANDGFPGLGEKGGK
jgi:hypothetical protein